MAANIVTVEDLENFRRKLLNDLQNIESQKMTTLKRWLKSEEVGELLGLSPGTLQQLRKNGTLPFTKLGGVLIYDSKDIVRMIESRKQNSKGDEEDRV